MYVSTYPVRITCIPHSNFYKGKQSQYKYGKVKKLISNSKINVNIYKLIKYYEDKS